MRDFVIRILVAAWAVILATPAWGDQRFIGAPRNPGSTSVSQTFLSRASTYQGGGLGVSASPPASGYNVLSGAARSNFGVNRMSLNAPLASQVGAVSSSGVRIKPVEGSMGIPGGLTGGSLAGDNSPVRLSESAIAGSAADYLENLGGAMEATKQGPITSLVPTQPGEYRDYMEAGEKAFSTGDYSRAILQFQLASRIGVDDPESNLSLAHTYFAAGKYSSACFRLCQAIKSFPELPILSLKPRKFYGDERLYWTHIQRLEDHMQRNLNAPEDFLLAAYFRWFEGSADEARRAITQGYQLSKKGRGRTDVAEAMEIFWDGMAATGKVAGRLDGSVPSGKSLSTTKQSTETKPSGIEK